MRITLAFLILFCSLNSWAWWSYDDRTQFYKRDIKINDLELQMEVLDQDPANFLLNDDYIRNRSELFLKSFENSVIAKEFLVRTNEFVLSDYESRNFSYESSDDGVDLLEQVFEQKLDPWQAKAQSANLKSEDDYLNRRSRVITLHEKGHPEKVVGTIKWIVTDVNRYFVKLFAHNIDLMAYFNGELDFDDLSDESKKLTQQWEVSHLKKAFESGGSVIEIENLVISKDYAKYDIFRLLLEELEILDHFQPEDVVGIQSLDSSLPIYQVMGFNELFKSHGMTYLEMNLGEFVQSSKAYMGGETDISQFSSDDSPRGKKISRYAKLLMRDRNGHNRKAQIKRGRKVKVTPNCVQLLQRSEAAASGTGQ